MHTASLPAPSIWYWGGTGCFSIMTTCKLGTNIVDIVNNVLAMMMMIMDDVQVERFYTY